MTKRLLYITEILLKENTYVTTSHIANLLNVSNKTIRNDILELEKIIKDFKLTLDKKTGSGIAIIGNENFKLNLHSNLKSRCGSIIAYSPEDRKIFILKQLLNSDSNLSIGYFAKSLHVSRATIHKDLILVEEWLSMHNILLIRNLGVGICISAKEKNIRKALGNLICSGREYVDSEKLLNSNHEYLSSLPSFKSFNDILDIDFSDLYEMLFSIKELNFDKCNDEALVTLLIHLSIAINRISKNNYVGISDKSHNNLMLRFEYKYVKMLSEKIALKFNLEFPDTEISYLLMLILGLNLAIENNRNIEEKVSSSSSILIVIDIINKWESILNIPLSKDNQLLSSLVLHLNPVIHKLRFSLPIYNPILEEIKSTYPYSYKVASCARDIINLHTGYNISEAEIGYLTVHLVSALDRNEKPLRTVLLCHSSMGVSELLYTKIIKECPNIDIVSRISLNNIDAYDFNSIDLLITTVPIQVEINCSIIHVNTLLRKEDISRLNKLVNKLFSDKNKIVTSIDI